MAKVNIYISDFYRYEIEPDVAFYEEDYVYEIPDDLLTEYEAVKEKSKKIQEKLHRIYKMKHGELL